MWVKLHYFDRETPIDCANTMVDMIIKPDTAMPTPWPFDHDITFAMAMELTVATAETKHASNPVIVLIVPNPSIYHQDAFPGSPVGWVVRGHSPSPPSTKPWAYTRKEDHGH